MFPGRSSSTARASRADAAACGARTRRSAAPVHRTASSAPGRAFPGTTSTSVSMLRSRGVCGVRGCLRARAGTARRVSSSSSLSSSPSVWCLSCPSCLCGVLRRCCDKQARRRLPHVGGQRGILHVRHGAHTVFVGTCVDGVVIDKAAVAEAEDVAVGRPCEWILNVGNVGRGRVKVGLLGVRGTTCLR